MKSPSVYMDEEKFYELSEYYSNPKHKFKMDNPTYKYENMTISCGDKFSVYLKVDGSKIADASFDGSGCVISTVSVSKLCDYLIGKDIDIIKNLDLKFIENLLGIGKINPSRVNCALIGLRAFKKALSYTEN